MTYPINRRNFLSGAAATATLLATARAKTLAAFASERKFAPVKVARDRVIREVVGLRPYRDEGFVVATEKLGNKLLIHNYGHGGAGITLSWGTASRVTTASCSVGLSITMIGRWNRARTGSEVRSSGSLMSHHAPPF